MTSCKKRLTVLIPFISFFLTQGIISPFQQAIAFSEEYVSESSINVSKGYGFVIENDVADARDKAINDALKNLLQKSLIDIIEFKQYLRATPLLLETLIATPQPFIESYRVLTEKQEGNIYVVSIEGRVYEGILRKRLSSMGLYLKEETPKILIMIVEKRMDGSLTYWWSGVESSIGRIERIVGDVFMDAGFSVIDPFAPPLVDIPLAIRTPFLTREDIKRFGDIYRVDFIFYGEIGSDKGALSSIFTERKEETWLKFKVFSILTGEVIISGDYKIHSSIPEISDNLLTYEKLSRDLSRRVVFSLIESLRERKGDKRIIEAVFLGTFNYKVYATIKKALEGMDKTVERVETRSLSRGRFTMNIEINSDISILLKGLQEKEWTDFMLRPSYIDRNRMILEILPKGGGI